MERWQITDSLTAITSMKLKVLCRPSGLNRQCAAMRSSGHSKQQGEAAKGRRLRE